MKENKTIITVSIILLIFFNIVWIVYYNYENNPINNLAGNIICGLCVSIVLSLIQYFEKKNMIKNSIYNSLFISYRLYNQCVLRKKYDGVLLSSEIYNSFQKINDYAFDYTYLIKKDKLYNLLNKDNIKIPIEFINKVSNNMPKKEFIAVFDDINNYIIQILDNINHKRFIKDQLLIQEIIKRIKDC